MQRTLRQTMTRLRALKVAPNRPRLTCRPGTKNIVLLLGLLLLGQLRFLPARLLLLLQSLLFDPLGLHLVDGFNEHALVLVGITLRVRVEGMVHVLVDLLRLPVLSEETPQDTLPAHPQDLRRHASLPSTLPLTNASMPAFPACFMVLAHTESGMHLNGFADDE